jgi:hypothetical protein
MPIAQYNVYEQFFYNYWAPTIYFYRLPIVAFFTIWAVVFGYFAFQTGTKSELQFLSDEHVLQRAYTLAIDKFGTALNDFSFVYLWGIKPKPIVEFSKRLTIDDYGTAEYDAIDIRDQRFQEHIQWSWDYLLEQDFIDKQTAVDRNFGVNGWKRMWDMWFGLANSTVFNIFDLVNVSLYNIFEILNETLHMDDPPRNYPITPQQYDDYGWIWQVFLSELAFEEPDMYVPGTLKANTIGFSLDDYSLLYFGIKANMNIPPAMNVENMRATYAQAQRVEAAIQEDAHNRGLPVLGWMTSVGWLTMATEEELPKQVVADVAIAFGAGAIVIFASTFSVAYTIFVIYSMLSTILLVMGSLYLTGWKIGCNEAIMISIASGFCADFIIQPMLALAHDRSGRSLFGKIQASLATFCTPVSSALVTTLVASCFLYPCEIVLFPPFATFLLLSGVFGIIQGFGVLPALVAFFSFDSKGGIEMNFGINDEPLFTQDNSDDVELLVGGGGRTKMPHDGVE